jgi:hypothetical protein
MATKLENTKPVETIEEVLIPFNFPAYGIVILATSIEEAEQKLSIIVKTK